MPPFLCSVHPKCGYKLYAKYVRCTKFKWYFKYDISSFEFNKIDGSSLYPKNDIWEMTHLWDVTSHSILTYYTYKYENTNLFC